MKSNPFTLLLKLSRPIIIVISVGQYLLGIGAAKYLGAIIDWIGFYSGLVWLLSLLMAMHYLVEYFNHNVVRDKKGINLIGGSNILGEGDNKLPANTALFGASAMLTITTLATMNIFRRIEVGTALGTVMMLSVVIAMVYSLPSFQLERSGFAELILALFVGSLSPFFGYLLQSGEVNRILAMATLPSTFLFLAVLIALDFPKYGSNIKFLRRNLLVRLGWENGIVFHNTLLLMAFVILGIAAQFGLPKAIALPAFLPLPLGLLQIWYLRQISQGIKPNWKALGINSLALFGSMTYLLAIAFWIR